MGSVHSVWQLVLLIFAAWVVLSVPLALIVARMFRRLEVIENRSGLPAVQEHYIDTLIDDVLNSQNGADQWLDHKKIVIAKVFADGEAWLDVQGNIVERDSDDAVAKVTFNVIRAAMMKFYASGILNADEIIEGREQ